MKKINKILKANKEYIIYPIVLIVFALYEYGAEYAIRIIAMLYAIVMPTVNSVDIYFLITHRKQKKDIRELSYITITSLLILGCYFVIADEMKVLILSLSVGLLIIFTVLMILFKGYATLGRNESSD